MTLAQFKRDVDSGKIYALELLYRRGDTGDDIPEHLRGVRNIIRRNSVALFLQGQGSMRHSELHIDNAKLFECDGETLTIYRAGYREPTSEEKALLEEWDRLEKEYEEKYPYGDCFWKKKHFFENSAYPYMSGFDFRGPRKYYPEKQMVLDHQVRGDAILQYKVHTAWER